MMKENLLTQYYKKSIRLTPDGFSLYNLSESGKLESRSFPVSENALLTKEAPIFFNFKEASEQHIDVIVGTQTPLLIPDILYEEDKAKEYLRLQYDITQLGKYYCDSLGKYRSLYFLTQNEYATLSALPCSLHFISEASLLCNFLQDIDTSDSLLISVNESFVDIIMTHRNEPVLVNRIFHIEPVDVLYYTLNCIQQYALSEYRLYVQYFGKANKRLNDLLQQYHPNVIIL